MIPVQPLTNVRVSAGPEFSWLASEVGRLGWWVVIFGAGLLLGECGASLAHWAQTL